MNVLCSAPEVRYYYFMKVCFV